VATIHWAGEVGRVFVPVCVRESPAGLMQTWQFSVWWAAAQSRSEAWDRMVEYEGTPGRTRAGRIAGLRRRGWRLVPATVRLDAVAAEV
jgi:hypothetical protein